MPAVDEFKTQIRNSEFASDAVMRLSERLGQELAQRQQGQREGKDVTRTQLRKFYNLVRVAQNTANGATVSPERVKVKLRTLQAQVAFAVGRKTISPDFKTFFDAAIEKVIGSDELKTALADFCTFFEAFYAYFYFHTEVREQ